MRIHAYLIDSHWHLFPYRSLSSPFYDRAWPVPGTASEALLPLPLTKYSLHRSNPRGPRLYCFVDCCCAGWTASFLRSRSSFSIRPFPSFCLGDRSTLHASTFACKRLAINAESHLSSHLYAISTHNFLPVSVDLVPCVLTPLSSFSSCCPIA